MARETNYTTCLIVNLWALWVLTWVLAVYAAISVVMSNWRRFQSNPTVISMDRSFMDFNTTVPAMTICLHGLLNKTRAGIFIDKKWVNMTTEKKSFYQDFLQTIANVSYENLENFEKFANDSSIPRDGYYQILQEISLDFPGFMGGKLPGLGSTDKWPVPERTMTDRGNCYTFNAALRRYQHDRRKGKHSGNNFVLRDTFKMRYEDGMAEIHANNLMSHAKFYKHSPLEASDVIDNSEFGERNQIDIASYKVTEVVSMPDVADLTIAQRKCRLPQESELVVSPMYSYSNCRLQCRMQLAVSLCGCSPYFYPLIDGFTECSIEGLLCLSKRRDNIKFLMDPKTNLPVESCKCMTTCNLVSYTRDTKQVAKWTEGSIFVMQIPKQPRTQLQRKVLYGPTDLLVSFGGTMGLFLGCSLLSAAEVIYFFTLRLGWQLSRQLQQ